MSEYDEKVTVVNFFDQEDHSVGHRGVRREREQEESQDKDEM